MNSLTIKAYAKLNLFLDIVGRRTDGYHMLHTVMQSVSVYDLLEFELVDGEGVELICDDANFPTDSSNLICKAYDAFFAYTRFTPKGKIRVKVQKNIPSMAGMAGGSADAAATLIALSEFYDEHFSRYGFYQLGSMVGADVPFMTSGGIAFCEGIGDKITQLIDLENICFVAVQPDIRISTKEAYEKYDDLPPLYKPLYRDFEIVLKLGDTKRIARKLFNILEIVVDRGEIDLAKDRLCYGGALGALMTGSGSVVYGVFDNIEKARECAELMKDYGYKYAEALEPVRSGIEIIKRGD